MQTSQASWKQSIAVMLLVCSAQALADTCHEQWQSLSAQYQAEKISMQTFIDEWQDLEPVCAGSGEYELNRVRLLSGEGHFEQAADLAQKASLLPDIGQSLKLNLFFAYLDNTWYLPGKAHAVTDRDFWIDARDQYQDLQAISSGNETLAWRLTEITYLAGADRQAYGRATDFLSSQPSAEYAVLVRQLLIRLCARSGRNGEAVFHYRQLQQTDPELAGQPDLMLVVARAAGRSGQYALAERLAQQIAQDAPRLQDNAGYTELRQLLDQR